MNEYSRMLEKEEKNTSDDKGKKKRDKAETSTGNAWKSQGRASTQNWNEMKGAFPLAPPHLLPPVSPSWSWNTEGDGILEQTDFRWDPMALCTADQVIVSLAIFANE
jgi:hypothetical protein